MQRLPAKYDAVGGVPLFSFASKEVKFIVLPIRSYPEHVFATAAKIIPVLTNHNKAISSLVETMVEYGSSVGL